VCAAAGLIAAALTVVAVGTTPVGRSRGTAPTDNASSVASQAGAATTSRTLRAILVAEAIEPRGLADADLDRRITSFAYENGARSFTIGYYLDTGPKLPDDLEVRLFDKTRGAWSYKALGTRDEKRLGSVMKVQHVGPFIYIDTHMNPSAGNVVVLTPDLERVATLYGWMTAVLGDGSALFTKSQVHFAPTHPFELGFFDAKTRVTHDVYPVPPYQPARRAYIARVREAYAALTRRDPGWQARLNHHGDPEQFDSRLAEPPGIAIVPGTRRFSFVVEFGDAQANAPTPEEKVAVTCDLARLPADPCREARKID